MTTTQETISSLYTHERYDDWSARLDALADFDDTAIDETVRLIDRPFCGPILAE